MSNKLFTRAATLALATVLSAGLALADTAGLTRYDTSIQSEVTHRLNKDHFQNVRATTQEGIVTLQGTVDRYKTKLEAEKRVRKADHVQGVRDLLEVSSTVPDAQLQQKLARKLAYDRVGYGHVFNALTLNVQNGVATVGGAVLNYPDRDSAVSLVENEPGVKDVVNNITVLPASPMDDDVRVRTLRAIYADPVLSRYAMDPQAPIRIVVDRGHVTLYGVVDSAMDKQIAGIRANQVFGAFSVDNKLAIRDQVSR